VGCYPFHSERNGAGGRELDGQRNAVQAPADCCDGRRNAPVRREVRLRRARPCDEQLNRAISQQILDILGAVGRHSERRHPVKALIRCSQRLAARRHHMCCRVGPQHCFSHARRGVDHMLAIIEHKQELPRANFAREVAQIVSVSSPQISVSPKHGRFSPPLSVARDHSGHLVNLS